MIAAKHGILTIDYILLTELLKTIYAFLFTYERAENLPKTNNGLDGEFAHLKTKLRVHSGLNFTNKMKFISHYFALKNKER